MPARAYRRRRKSYTSVTVPTVERGFRLVVFWSMEITGLKPVILSTSGRCIWPMKPRAYEEKVSMYRRWPSAKIVSKAKDDLPEPLKPVITVSFFLGIDTLMFFRLCTRAPTTSIFPSSFICPNHKSAAKIQKFSHICKFFLFFAFFCQKIWSCQKKVVILQTFSREVRGNNIIN